jgi:hypothetical protein
MAKPDRSHPRQRPVGEWISVEVFPDRRRFLEFREQGEDEQKPAHEKILSGRNQQSQKGSGLLLPQRGIELDPPKR